MLTRNFDNLMAAHIAGAAAGAIYTSGNDNITEENWLNGTFFGVKTTDSTILTADGNSTRKGLLSDFNGDKYSDFPNSTTGVLLVGSNTAEEAYNDYKLDVITTLTVFGTREQYYTMTADGATVRASKVFINNTDADITINEAGIFQRNTGYYATATSSGSTKGGFCLLYRKKYDTPIVVPANGGTVNIVLDIDLPLWNKPSE